MMSLDHHARAAMRVPRSCSGLGRDWSAVCSSQAVEKDRICDIPLELDLQTFGLSRGERTNPNEMTVILLRRMRLCLRTILILGSLLDTIFLRNVVHLSQGVKTI